MKRTRHLGILLFVLWLSFFAVPMLSADVAPGDVIDKTTWQKAEGLLPESVLNWVKKGDFILDVGKLNYDFKEYYPEWLQESYKTNLGKYELNDKDLIINKSDGSTPGFILGVPFPVIDTKDPRTAAKIMYNREYGLLFNVGNCIYRMSARWLGKTGFEREVGSLYINAPMDGYPGAKSLANPEGVLRYTIISVTKPYDVAGFALLLWRYRDDRQDLNLAYLPAIRRVRRMSPANRSDSFVGSDFCIDDPYGYDGKITAFTWKFIRTQEALLPFVSPDPVRVAKNSQGEWTTYAEKGIVYGHQKEGWQGAAWAPVSLLWVKRPVYVLEAVSKDPYYNYGKMEIWVDVESCGIVYKVIYDRAGAYWKTFYGGVSGVQGDDGKTRFTMVRIQNIVDDRSQHSSVIWWTESDFITFNAKLNMDDFTLSGFQKYCK